MPLSRKDTSYIIKWCRFINKIWLKIIWQHWIVFLSPDSTLIWVSTTYVEWYFAEIQRRVNQWLDSLLYYKTFLECSIFRNNIINYLSARIWILDDQSFWWQESVALRCGFLFSNHYRDQVILNLSENNSILDTLSDEIQTTWKAMIGQVKRDLRTCLAARQIK